MKYPKLMSLAALSILTLFIFVACTAAPETSSSLEGPTLTESSAGNEPESVTSAAPEGTTAQADGSSADTANASESNTLLGNFTATTIDGQEVTQDIFKDQPLTMLNIWATYCGPCLNEMPDLGDLHREYQEKGFQIVGIPIDVFGNNNEISQSQVDLAKEVIDKTGANYTNILPSADLIAAGVTSVQAVPTTIFLDQNGNPVGDDVYLGSRSKSEWESIINELLAEVENREAASVDGEIPDVPTSAMATKSFSFSNFATSDIDGNPVTSDILEGDLFSNRTLALIWNPEWEGSKEALEKLRDYMSEYDNIRGIGFVMGLDETNAQKAKALSDEAGGDILQLAPIEGLDDYISTQQPQVIVLSTWGTIYGTPFPASQSLEEWDRSVQGATMCCRV